MQKRLAIFASGSGSNAENICTYFKNSSDIDVVLICTNNPKAAVVKKAERLNIPVLCIDKSDLNNFDELQKKLKNKKVDALILAGFLLKIPAKMIENYPNRIINIHPSLLPKYGGKGMYGKYVHKAVLENNETESGISIHYVNQNYDEGKIISQKKCSISKNETIESLTDKIQKLEHNYFPKVIEKTILNI